MALGKKYGGRTKGTPNKRTATIEQKLKKLGCDPIAGLAELAMNAEDLAIRATCMRELAQYVAPKRKALEVSGEIAETVIYRAAIPERKG